MDRICPLLALVADRRTAIDGIDGAHRCHASDPPMTIERAVQGQLCLTPAHERCERYLQYVARTGVAHPGRAAIADGLVSTRLVLAPEPAWRGIAGRARRARSGALLAVVAAVLVVAAASIAAVAAVTDGGAGLAALLGVEETPRPTATPEPTSTASAAATPEASASAEPTPIASPSPTAAATAPPTPPPTPAPTPVPTPQRTYVVQEGDTLAGIAQQFGTSVESLQAANGIDDPDEIVIGQVLVIP